MVWGEAAPARGAAHLCLVSPVVWGEAVPVRGAAHLCSVSPVVWDGAARVRGAAHLCSVSPVVWDEAVRELVCRPLLVYAMSQAAVRLALPAEEYFRSHWAQKLAVALWRQSNHCFGYFPLGGTCLSF